MLLSAQLHPAVPTPEEQREASVLGMFFILT